MTKTKHAILQPKINAERGEAIGLHKAGWTQQKIADELGYTQKGVSLLL